MLWTSVSIGSSDIFPTAVVVEDVKVESGGGGGRADEMIELSPKNIKNLSKAKKSAKARCSEQPTFLSSSVLFMKDDSDWYRLATFEAPSEKLIIYLCWFIKSLSSR